MTSLHDKFPLFDIDGLSRDEVINLAFETGLCERKSGKIDVADLLQAVCIQSLEGTVSYNDLAAKIESLTGNSVSRQAYHQRMNDKCVAFFKRVLEKIIRSNHKEDIEETVRGSYTRILVQDSTILRLPKRLFDDFSGVKNAFDEVCNARIQGVYDLLSRQFISFSIDSYKKTTWMRQTISPMNQVI
jgi:hypothetical protein